MPGREQEKAGSASRIPSSSASMTGGTNGRADFHGDGGLVGVINMAQASEDRSNREVSSEGAGGVNAAGRQKFALDRRGRRRVQLYPGVTVRFVAIGVVVWNFRNAVGVLDSFVSSRWTLSASLYMYIALGSEYHISCVERLLSSPHPNVSGEHPAVAPGIRIRARPGACGPVITVYCGVHLSEMINGL